MKLNLFLLFSLGTFCLSLGQDAPRRFRHLTMDDGLSQSSVTCILKDSKGFMWFGTEDGLNRYDGNRIVVYRHQPNDSTSLSSSYITALAETDDGNLWVGTNDGLNRFETHKNQFRRFQHHPSNTNSLSHNRVNKLFVTSRGGLMIGTMDGLDYYDAENGFHRYNTDKIQKPFRVWSFAEEKNILWVLSREELLKIPLKSGRLQEVVERTALKSLFESPIILDSLGLWIGTDKGLFRYTKSSGKLDKVSICNYASDKPSHLSVMSMIRGPENTLWIGTKSNGLFQLHTPSGYCTNAVVDASFKSSLNSNAIRSLFLDEDQILWAGTFGGGVNKYDPGQPKFSHYKAVSGKPFGLSDNGIRGIMTDSKNRLWVGTHGGLNLVNRHTGQSQVFKNDPNNNRSISSNTVRSLCEDHSGTIWAGTWLNGLNRLNEKTKEFDRFYRLPGQTDSINQVRTLIVDADNNLWIGGYGLWRYHHEKKESEVFFYHKKGETPVAANSINMLFFDSNGLLWVATKDGLNSMDIKSKSIKNYPYEPDDPKGLSHKYVTSIAEDLLGNIWVGTYGGGLNQLDIKTGVFKHFNTSNGLLNDVIYGVLIDAKNRVWFSSNAGLSYFDPATGKFRYFDEKHGIQNKEFNAGAYFESQDGMFFFGGINGLNAFNPLSIDPETINAPIVFTEFSILNDLKGNPEEAVPETTAMLSDTLWLEYDQNSIAIRFAELNYTDGPDRSYEYNLSGSGAGWKPLEDQRQIVLGSLNPGNYELKVRTVSAPANESSVSIVLRPPYWKSSWAYIVYFVVLMTMVLFTVLHFLRVRSTRKQFEAEITNLENHVERMSKSQSSPHSISLSPLKAKPEDQKVIQQALQIVEKHYANSNFDVAQFATEMHMSKSQLYRKITAYTGCSPSKFVRLIRLKKAAQLLSSGAGSVSGVAYEVGFDNLGYFSKCFTETFGVPPSQYKLLAPYKVDL
ncbi:MAG: two-component regulator propeller domain-containing protein [Bacteroidota bacterium]